MATHKVDSWGPTQLANLREFFTRAQPGDSVVFDRKMAENNVPAHEGLDDKGCNSWVYHVANMALKGLPEEHVKMLIKDISLTTDFLHSHYPEAMGQIPPEQTATEEEPAFEEEADLLEDGPEDDEEAAWARTVARYHTRHDHDL